MRTRDLFSLAIRNIQPSFGVAHVLIIAFAVACFCFSIATWETVNMEKAEPCELKVTAPSYLDITEQSVQDIITISDVIDASGILTVPVTARSGKYESSLTLMGIDGDYLDVTYSAGSVFPTGSAMPWIILSEAAAKTFMDPMDKAKHDDNYMPSIDWLDAEFALTVGENIIAGKVSGIFEDENAAAYISQDMAKQLLQRQGRSSSYTSIAVRVTNIGTAGAAAKAISGLGYEVTGRDDSMQEKWDVQLRESFYTLVLGIAGACCAVMLEVTYKTVDRRRNQSRNYTLSWLGMSSDFVRWLDIVRYCCLESAGIGLGVLFYYTISVFNSL